MKNPTRPRQAAMPCKALRFLYRTLPGRVLLRLMIAHFPAKLSACYLNSRLSRGRIRAFIRKNHIDTARYEDRVYRSYNDYFTRKQKEGITVYDSDPNTFTSPCDSRLSVYRIGADSVFSIKDSLYSTADLLNDPALAARYEGGTCLIFRLCVDDYHRYSFVDDGETEKTVAIRGVLHTVQPIATERYNIYKQNAREVTVQHSTHFGTLTYVEVGAMLIGKICNHHRTPYAASRGEEKGYFEYGGSTVVLLVEKDRLTLDREFWLNTAEGYETIVRLGETIGYATPLSSASTPLSDSAALS